MFATQYDRFQHYHSPSGSRMKDVFQLVTEPDGNTRLVKTCVKDVYQEIQSYKASCQIENIVRRALNGDPTALAKRQGVFGDTTFDGGDLIAANEAIKQAQAIYRGLPAEKRAEYGSFDNFVRSFGTLDGIKNFVKPSEKASKATEAPEEASGGSEGGAA